MGSEISQEEAQLIPSQVYAMATVHIPKDFPQYNPQWIPDVGIDESLLKYSGMNSNTELKTYSTDLINTVPGFVSNLGSSLSSFNSVPNAVGLGALVISMIMEICIKSTSQTNDDSYSMLQRVFGEEKASTVRNTMLEYVKRHRMFMKYQQRLHKELQRLEQQLSSHLTTLKTSLQDGQMSTRGFKIWVNGASFHVQMLIHEARLNNPTGQHSSQYVDSINTAIDVYVQDLENLLEKYKAFKTSKTLFSCSPGFIHPKCCVEDLESGWKFNHCLGGSDFAPEFMDYVFSHHEPITGLESHFLNIKNNLNSLINQHSAFTLRYARA